jgi:hypothetical protein
MTKNPPIKKRQTRGAVRKDDSHFIGLWIPEDAVRAIDHAVQTLDTDRSKFIRLAIREAIRRGLAS